MKFSTSLFQVTAIALASGSVDVLGDPALLVAVEHLRRTAPEVVTPVRSAVIRLAEHSRVTRDGLDFMMEPGRTRRVG